ncbi:unnamed protein product [Closterium sp. NIES-64]|nr:unnamed protein product [Closterium sp. NIES-65]CAI5949446.1 unnamed protein product [Closterium sp. NIES-64]
MDDEGCDEAAASLLSHESEPECAQVAGMASDLVVTIGQRAFLVHQYPLYALLAFDEHQYPLYALLALIHAPDSPSVPSFLLRSPLFLSLPVPSRPFPSRPFPPPPPSPFPSRSSPLSCSLSMVIASAPAAAGGRPCRLSPHSVLLVRSAAPPAALPALPARALVLLLTSEGMQFTASGLPAPAAPPAALPARALILRLPPPQPPRHINYRSSPVDLGGVGSAARP